MATTRSPLRHFFLHCRSRSGILSKSRNTKDVRSLCTKPTKENVNPTGHSSNRVPLLGSAEGGLTSYQWLSQYGPQFLIRGEQVQVITEPDQFYQVLKLKTKKAKRRVTYASLYLGNGHLEKELVSCLKEACKNSVTTENSDFEMNILLDYTRGSRGENNSRTMLCPLMEEFDCVRVSLFHTPQLRGLLKKIIPDRFNETIGLTHIKIYLFDDSFIISGANLSNDYFVNRQDRYMLFNDCPELADFFNDLVKAVMSFSLSLSTKNTTHLASDWNIHPYKDTDNGLRFKLAAREKIHRTLQSRQLVHTSSTLSETTDKEKKNFDSALSSHSQSRDMPDTAVYPLLQMGPLGLHWDEMATLAVLRSSQPQDHVLLASGYFNLTDHYMGVILDQSVAKYSILMASPQANGFLGAKGIAGAIPYSYIYLAHQFYKQVMRRSQEQRIHLMEYWRDGWTFHGKGLWLYPHNHSLPVLSLVGSPNFGYRSVYKDLECQVAIVTENQALQEQLREEHVHMFSSSSAVTESTFHRRDRYVAHWIRMVTKVIKHYF